MGIGPLDPLGGPCGRTIKKSSWNRRRSGLKIGDPGLPSRPRFQELGVKMQAAEPVSMMKVSESEGKLEGPVTAGTPSKSNSSSRGASAKGWQYSDHMENVSGYLMKYTNLVTGWQYSYRC